MVSDDERLKILDMVEKGQISAEDAVRLLEAIGNGEAELTSEEDTAEGYPSSTIPGPVEFATRIDESPTSPGNSSDFVDEDTYATASESEPEIISPHEKFDPSAMKWRNFWWVPMWVGVGVTVISALFMYWAYSGSGFGFWFACSWFPFALGVMVMALAWASRSARWLHVRVYQKAGQKPERIAISLPIPLHLTAWLLRVFGKKIPNMGETSLDEVIMALDATSPEAPFYVEVNEGDDGERVEVYIG